MIARAGVCLVLLLASAVAQTAEVLTPSELFGDLFVQVQEQQVFADGKTFVDAVPRSEPARIRAEYERARNTPGFDLKAFVAQHFAAPSTQPSPSASDAPGALPKPPTADAAGAPPKPSSASETQGATSKPPSAELAPEQARAAVRAHIDELWPQLTRQPDKPQPHSSLLPLPHPYVVPGGRFREIYYWDSYFTMVGLEESGRHDLTDSMLANFADLIDRYGHIPNGNRSYYLSRSQPPFFAAMVELAARRDGDAVYRRYLPQLEREHAFWMEGAEGLARNRAHRRVVRLKDGSLLNRHWDDRATPREESYREDVGTARKSGRPVAEVYRNLRAGAESGWDFSSRWFSDGRRLETIRVIDIVPIDLNSLLYRLEQTLATAHRVSSNGAKAQDFGARAWARRQAVQRYLWNEEAGAFGDYDWRRRRLTPQLTAATAYPLYFGLATPQQSGRVATFIRQRLLQPDGLATSAVNTGEQWDAPNGWAPLQWIGIAGLRNSGSPELAREIACRWIRENVDAWAATGKLVEKYDVSGSGMAGGGEYPLQDGFGWTNGVLRRLLALYPEATCTQQAAAANTHPHDVRRDSSTGLQREPAAVARDPHAATVLRAVAR